MLLVPLAQLTRACADKAGGSCGHLENGRMLSSAGAHAHLIIGARGGHL